MDQEVYVDLLFLINFSMDYLCLYICVKVLHRKLRLMKMLIASSIGGMYSVISLFMPFSPAIELSIDCLVCLIMCALVFSERGRSLGSTLVCAFLYTGISMMMGGCMTAIFNLLNKLDIPLDAVQSDGISTYLFAILAVLAGIISLKSGQIIARRSNIRECKLRIRFCGQDFEFLGLCDSGNLVRDPISSKPVIFVDRKILSNRLDLSFMDEYQKGIIKKDSPCKNLRLIVINTANGSSMITAALPESIYAEPLDVKKQKIHKLNKQNSKEFQIDALISPYDADKGGENHNAIIPADIIKQM